MSGDDYYEIGAPLAGGPLTSALAKRTLAACREDPRFELVELRELTGAHPADVIVVECRNDGVPSKSSRGIRYIERLALVFGRDDGRLPETWALRRQFPATEHQNASLPGMPASLCLYFEPWPTVARSWTARKHLQRIVRWLADVAAGELHRADQPVEQFYFDAPWELVIPPEVRLAGVSADHVLAVTRVSDSASPKGLLVSSLVRRADVKLATPVSAVFVSTDPVIGGVIERPATSMGELALQLARRGTDIIRPLVDEIDRLTDGTGVATTGKEQGLIILRIPIARVEGGAPERFQVQGFLLEKGIGPLGEALGLLRRDGRKFHRAVLLGADRYAVGEDWKGAPIFPIAVIEDLSISRARELTGVAAGTADFSGVLIGAGSLGSQLAELWGRECWGTWTIIDHDHIKPHNIPRHRAPHHALGAPKAEVVAAMIAASFPNGVASAKTIVRDASGQDADVLATIARSGLIVDASTTLHVPRDLAANPQSPRVASTFLTPSGQQCVLMLEDHDRAVKIDSLEAQYYRAVLQQPWGEHHLSGHLEKALWVGAGCREVTTVLSPEVVALLGGTIARQLRKRRDSDEAFIGIWRHDEKTGSLIAETVAVAKTLSVQRGDWRVVWDTAVLETVRALRGAALPRETGGVLVGYIDQMAKTIFVVNALSAPADSVESAGSFTRGVDGLRDSITQMGRRTGGIVGYVGEWHSHPDRISTKPSVDDIRQLTFVAAFLREDGDPAVMLVVGEDDERFVVGEIVPIGTSSALELVERFQQSDRVFIRCLPDEGIGH